MIPFTLPIDKYKNEILNAVNSSSAVVIKAEPGAGKTTRIPVILFQNGFENILILEPRRLAAQMPCLTLKKELGESVGYQVRFENKTNSKTKIKFITEGIFAHILSTDPTLSKYQVIIIDEIHERHLGTDFAFAVTRQLQKTSRPDLKLLLMSATFDFKLSHASLFDAKIIECEGKNFAVSVYYEEFENKKFLEEKVLEGFLWCQKKEFPGDYLIFLPGIQEMRRCMEYLNPYAKTLFELHLLHSEISSEDQEKVFKPSTKRKIILATNIAETSVTIPGVQIVIDSGLSKQLKLDDWTGIGRLETTKISQSSCKQRTGRAGRTSEGYCLRLFSQTDFRSRNQQDKAEIEKLDLTQFWLDVLNLPQGLTTNPMELPWIEAPLESKISASLRLLDILGAVDQNQKLNLLGRQLSKLPFHPRISRMILCGTNLGIPNIILMCACIISEGGIFSKDAEIPDIDECDICFQFEIINGRHVSNLAQKFVRTDVVQRIKKIFDQTQKLLDVPKTFEIQNPKWKQFVASSILQGNPDRVVKVSKLSASVSQEFLFCLGGSATLGLQSVVKQDEFAIAVTVDCNNKGLRYIRLATAISVLQLLDFPNFYNETKLVYWDEKTKKFRKSIKTLYGEIIIDSSIVPMTPEENDFALRERLSKNWPYPFEENDYQSTKVRLTLLQAFCPENYVLDFSDSKQLENFIQFICNSNTNMEDILKESLESYVFAFMDPKTSLLLKREFPEKFKLQNGRELKIIYDSNHNPTIIGKIQDFFGLKEMPCIGGGRTPLVIKLLSPSLQVVQITNSLSNFWKNFYPAQKVELGRKYPRHFWPEDPTTAAPPEFKKRLFSKKH